MILFSIVVPDSAVDERRRIETYNICKTLDSLKAKLTDKGYVLICLEQNSIILQVIHFPKNNDEFQLLVMSKTKLRFDGCIVNISKSFFLTVIFLSDKF